MTDDRNVNDDKRDSEQSEKTDANAQDRMKGRSFAGSEYANTEQGQTRERERVVKQSHLDEVGEPTDEALDPQGDLSPRRRDVGR